MDLEIILLKPIKPQDQVIFYIQEHTHSDAARPSLKMQEHLYPHRQDKITIVQKLYSFRFLHLLYTRQSF
ncbi:hypothetical protein I7I48_01759 [Histoplasma ohiense]|nr:hypothetical protein I7I48_01759 [Histoplasma ohiense (nom. inval.)]